MLLKFLSFKSHMFDIPSSAEARWAHEVTVMQPVILEEDLSKVK